MKFVIQELLNNYRYVQMLEQSLKERGIEYYILSISNDNKEILIDKDIRIPIDNQKEIMNSILTSDSVFVYGGKAISKWAKMNNLNPGTFETDKLNFSNIPETLRKYLLNDDCISGPLHLLNPIENEFFIRPDGNNKLIPGKLMSKEELDQFKQENEQHRNEIFLISKPKRMGPEYRLFIVNDNVVASSKYAENGRADLLSDVPIHIKEFGEKIASEYMPADAYVLDLTEYDGEIKIVEYNNINTSALYCADVNEIINAILKLEK